MWRLVLIILILITTPAEGQVRVRVRVSDVDSLRLEITLPEIIEQLEQKIVHAKDLLRERKWKTTKAFYDFQTSRKVLQIISTEAANLEKLYQLNIELAQKGEITDTQLLQSHNAWLSKKIAVILKKNECRNSILEIARLAHLKIVVDRAGADNGQKKKADTTSNE